MSNKPIFIVGSPRSGTSILTWCLGQHPNILLQEESDWIGRFAIDVGVAFATGTARGERSQLSSLGVQSEDFFASFGATINDIILSHRKEFEKRANECAATAISPQMDRAFKIARSQSDPKTRWVDGTPEYSLYICGLRKLFPAARFIHVVRDVSSVIRSMVRFSPTGGGRVVANEQEAYEYWLRTVRSCVKAEQAYGPNIVLRMRYREIMNSPEASMRSMLDFLGETYDPACLEPLQRRINSSQVPVDFKTSGTPPEATVLDEAMLLDGQLDKNRQPRDPSPAIAQELEAAFSQQVYRTARLGDYLEKARRALTQLQKELDERNATALGVRTNPIGWITSFFRPRKR